MDGLDMVKTSLGFDFMYRINMKMLNDIPLILTLAFTPLFNKP